MALLWLESFDWIDQDTNGSALETIMLRRYAEAQCDFFGNARIYPGRGGGGCMGWRTISNRLRTPDLQTEQAGNTWIVGMAFRKYRWGPDNVQFLRICDSGGNVRFGLSAIWNTVLRVDGQSALTYVPDILTKTWHWYYIELKVYIHNTLGSYEVRIDGVTVASDTNVDTAYGGDLTSCVSFWGAGNGDAENLMWATDDIYICDASGSLNNDFLGPIHVKHLAPDGDGDDEDWSLSSGVDSYALVNETSPADDDSDYIEDSTTGNRTIFTFGNVPTGQTGIVGVQQWTNARVTDATSYTLKQTMKSGGTLYPQTGQSITSQSFAQYRDLYETDPDTGVAWTESGLNAIQAGVEVG